MVLFRLQRMYRIEKSYITRILKDTMKKNPTLALIKGYLNINMQTPHMLINSVKYMLTHT